jgi:hypothetical protein
MEESCFYILLHQTSDWKRRTGSAVGFTILLAPEKFVQRTVLEILPIVLNTPGGGYRFATGRDIIKYLDG